VNGKATSLVTHMISGKQSKVGLGSMLRITTLKVVELGTVCEGIVAVLRGKSKYVDVIRSTGTFRSVRKEESCTTPKEDINNWPEWGTADKVFCDDPLIVTVIHV
jgi:hypothetical protein